MDISRGSDPRAAHTDIFYYAKVITLFNQIINLDWAFCHENETAGKIVDQVAHAKPHTKGNGVSRQ